MVTSCEQEDGTSKGLSISSLCSPIDGNSYIPWDNSKKDLWERTRNSETVYKLSGKTCSSGKLVVLVHSECRGPQRQDVLTSLVMGEMQSTCTMRL